MILPYGVDVTSGALTPGTPLTLNGGLTAVAEVVYSGAMPHLYALSSYAPARPVPGQVQPGGQINHYLPGTAGALTYSSSTPFTTGSPVGMALAVMNVAVPATP